MGAENCPTALLSPTVLVIDDEAAVRNAIAIILENAGYRVLVAGSIVEVAKIVHERDTWIDIVLSDVVMPGQNGIELVARLRTERPHILPVFMSGFCQTAAMQRPVLGGPGNYLQKPFGAGQLLACLSKALNCARIADENATKHAMRAN